MEAVAKRREQDPVQVALTGRLMRGIDYLKGIETGEIPPPPIAELMGFDGVEFGEGTASFWLTPAHRHYNPLGTVHGGVAATMLDSAMSSAVHTVLPAATGYTTLEMKVNFVRPISADTGRIRATGTVVHVGRRVATAEGRIEDSDGRLLAHGTTTCLVLQPEG